MSSVAQTCPHCGALTARGATFCQVCGYRLTLQSGPSVLAVLGAVFLLLAAAGLGLFGACFALVGASGEASLLAVGVVLLGLALAAVLGATTLLVPKHNRT